MMRKQTARKRAVSKRRARPAKRAAQPTADKAGQIFDVLSLFETSGGIYGNTPNTQITAKLMIDSVPLKVRDIREAYFRFDYNRRDEDGTVVVESGGDLEIPVNEVRPFLTLLTQVVERAEHDGLLGSPSPV
jgi:hypothetical protein